MPSSCCAPFSVLSVGSKAVIISYCERGKELLRSTNDEQPLFSTQQSIRKAYSRNTLAQHFHYLYGRAGVTGASSHSGRRKFITTLATKGVGVRLLAGLAGHRSIATTQQYIDVNDDLTRRAVELV